MKRKPRKRSYRRTPAGAFRIYRCEAAPGGDGVTFVPPLPLVLHNLHAWSAARQAFVPVDQATPSERVFLPGTVFGIPSPRRLTER